MTGNELGNMWKEMAVALLQHLCGRMEGKPWNMWVWLVFPSRYEAGTSCIQVWIVMSYVNLFSRMVK